MWRKYFKACSVHCHGCLTSRDVKLVPTYISNSLSEALPTLFVQFTSAIRLSESQRTHGTLSCCAALIETANGLLQAKWAGRNRGGGKKPDKCDIKVWLQKGFSHVIQVFSDSHPLCAFHTDASQIVVFSVFRVLFRMLQGERIPHYRRGELLLFATGSEGKLHALSLVFINGQCRTKKLCRHNRRASEPLHP